MQPSKKNKTRPTYGAKSKPQHFHQHCCPHCSQIFQSVHSLAEAAVANHRGRSRSCFPTIQKSAPSQQLAVDDIQAMIFTEDGDECLSEHIDWTRCRLNPDMNYSAVELNDAVHEMLLREEADKSAPIEEYIYLESKPASNDFLQFQITAETKFSLPESDRSIFNLRNRVMWQDVLSLHSFGLQANLSEALGGCLLDLIGEIIERHRLTAIPLHKSWKRLTTSVGRKLVPTESVCEATALVFISATLECYLNLMYAEFLALLSRFESQSRICLFNSSAKKT
jgi:hypothetical protein